MSKIRRVLVSSVQRFFETDKGRSLIYRFLDRHDLILCRRFPDHMLLFPTWDYIGRHLLKHGEYQRLLIHKAIELARDARRLPQGGIMLEIGANIGTHTIYASLEHDFKCQIALEPDPRTFDLLQRNIALNNLSGRVLALNTAAGSNPGHLPFVQDVFNFGASHIAQSANETTISVEVDTIDNILQKNKKDPRDVRLVWMDVEAFELEVLNGMSKLLSQKPVMLMEFNPHDYSEGKQALIADILYQFYERILYYNEDTFVPVEKDALVAMRHQTDILALE